MRFTGLSALLSRVLDSFSSGLLRNVLMGAGLTFGSTIVMTTIIDAYIDSVYSSIDGIPKDVLAFMSMSNMDYALSVILSAIVSRVTMNSMGIFLKKK